MWLPILHRSYIERSKMDQLSNLLDNHNARVLSIVGLAKNTGKTNTLNYVIHEFANKDVICGLTSTGRDGEGFDVLTSAIKKPSIYVTKGNYIATASQFIKNLGDNVTALLDTGFRTQMGNVQICRINNACAVQLAGPLTNKGIKEVTASRSCQSLEYRRNRRQYQKIDP
jgi:hypothetical protein